MPAPLATEKVLRGVLQSFVRSGVVASDADVDILESIPNNATDVDISNILDTIQYGAVGGGGSILTSENMVSDEDITMYIDADDSDTPLLHPNVFRVFQNATPPPLPNQLNELLTVGYRQWSVADAYPVLTVGAVGSLCVNNQGAVVRVGASSAGEPYAELLGAPDKVYGGLGGLSVRSKYSMDFRCDENIAVSDLNGNYLRGGWETPNTAARLHVGDWLATPQDSLVIEAEDVVGGGFNDFTIRPTAAGLRRLFIRGSDASLEYYSHTVIGGKAGETWSEPLTFGGPTLLVVGDDTTTTAGAAYVYDRKTARDSWSSVMTIKAMTPITTANFYYFRVLDESGTGVFSVDGNGNANGPLGFTTGAADVAESVVTDEVYAPGTVLAIRGGAFVKTSAVGQTNVAGVVSTKPGMLLGNPEDPAERADRTKLAICGFVPVMCSTAGGDILGDGEALVSGPDGTAVIDPDPRPGTIIGKAKGRLIQDGDSAVKGLVEALVNLQ